jgi:hypothetical protein
MPRDGSLPSQRKETGGSSPTPPAPSSVLGQGKSRPEVLGPQSTKTSLVGRRTGTRTGPPAQRPPPPTPAPAGFPIQHSPQSLTTLAATELLLGGARPDRKADVTARSPAGPAGKILRRGCCALALARRGRLQLRHRCGNHRCRGGFLRDLGFDGLQRLLPAGSPLLALALAITTGLLLATLLAVRAGPIPPTTLPAAPLDGLLATGSTAIAFLGEGRPEGLFTALQETTTRAQARSGFGSPTGGGPMRWQAHGSGQLPGSGRGAGGGSTPRRSQGHRTRHAG